jgi:prepilin-type N-terminal cleavage/methylation domain-containing protein
MRSPRFRQRGLTLAELLVAMALAGVVMTMAFKIMHQAGRFMRTQRAVSDASRAGWQAVDRLCRELAMAGPPSAFGAEATFEGIDGAATFHDLIPENFRLVELTARQKAVRLDADLIRFPVGRLADAPGGERPGMVEYSLKRDKGGRIVGLLRRAAPFGTPLEQGYERLLNAQTVSLNFQYRDAEGVWHTAWDADAPPRAVRVTIGVLATWTTGKPRVIQFSSVVYLPTGMRISR